MKKEKSLIIMVDDNLANLRIGKNVLAENYTVATAPSAEKLFSLLENNRPELILLDVNMPELDGYDTIKILKSKPETKDIPVIFLTARIESEDELTGLSLGAIDYITKPFKPSLLLKRIEVHLLVEAQKRDLEKLTAKLQNMNDNLQAMVDEKTKDIQELQKILLKGLSELVESRDNVTGGHIERTQNGIKILINGIKDEGIYQDETEGWDDMNLLLQSSQLHDVGKIHVNEDILNKPGKLNPEEFTKMKKHTSEGEKIIRNMEPKEKEHKFLTFAKIFAAYHHEKWDGTGYPYGLKENEIPLLGRIMAIADVYDALTTVRPYKDAFTHEEAVMIINEGKGTHFDPVLVDLFNKKSELFKS